MPKVLIIRFSSIGDIFQCLWTVPFLRESKRAHEIHWLVRSDMAEILDGQVDQIWPFDKKAGLSGLWKLARQLHQQEYELVYDAHNNLRSLLIRIMFAVLNFSPGQASRPQWVRRPKSRWRRWLLFRWRINRFQKPFVGAKSYIEPLLGAWPGSEILQNLEGPRAVPSLSSSEREEIQRLTESLQGRPFYCLAPSAAWPLKRWPTESWTEFVRLRSREFFLILGGPQDSFCQEISSVAQGRVINLAGRLNLRQSLHLVHQSRGVLGADTGLLHAADWYGAPAILLIGPSAFGYPVRKSSLVLERDLPCKPCSKDGSAPCKNPIYQQCLRDIPARDLDQKMNEMMS